jgi:competence ComEA-like helix-hairpin-helix protein
LGRGVFTREERAVVLFLVLSLSVGTTILSVRKVAPSVVPAFDGAGRSRADTEVTAEPCWPVDINTAGPDDLVRLPGIGPARAAAIVSLRSERGGFRSVEELLDVRGIGPVTLEGLRPLATAGAPAGSLSAVEADKGDSVP